MGISSILVGIGAVVVADQTKLTATKLLLGGFYVKDEYREVLLYAGVALAVFGGLLVILAAARSAEPAAVSSLSFATGLLLMFTLAGAGIVYAAYKNAHQDASSASSGGLAFQQPQASPAAVSTQSSDYPSPCTLYLTGRDAQLTITGPNASTDCAAFASAAAPSGQTWTTTAVQPTGTLSQACDLVSGSDEIVVTDDGLQVYGSQACNTFSSQGWTSAAQSSSTVTTGSSGASGCNCGVADLPNRCDPNISSTSDVSCRFAENTFYEYWKTTGGNPSQQTNVQAWSSTDQQYYTESCSSGDGVVDCGYGTGSDVRFNQTAVTAYTQSEAAAYAASADLGPTG